MRIGILVIGLVLVGIACSAPAPDAAGSATEISWLDVYEEARNLSKASGKPLLVEFTADWCYPCQQLKSETYVHPAVIAASLSVVSLRVDTASGTDTAKALVKKYEVDVLPTFIVIGADGKKRPKLRRSGFMNPMEFRRYLMTVESTP